MIKFFYVKVVKSFYDNTWYAKKPFGYIYKVENSNEHGFGINSYVIVDSKNNYNGYGISKSDTELSSKTDFDAQDISMNQ